MASQNGIYWGAGMGIVLLCAGCLSVPTEQRFREMEADAIAGIAEVQSLSRRSPDASTADKVVQDLLSDELTVENAVRIALANHPRLQLQYQKLDVAAAEQLASRLLKNPTVEALWKVSEEDSNEKVLEIGAEVDVLHMILLPRRRRIGTMAYEAVKLDVARAVQQLAFRTRIAYFRLLASQQKLAMRQSVQKAAAASHEMAERLREAGNIKKLEVLNRKALYEQAMLGVSAAELALTEAREDLNLMMGLDSRHGDWTTDAALPVPAEQAPPLIEASLETALDNSMQLAIIRRQIEAAAERYGIARVESVLPALHVGAEGERESNGTWMIGAMVAVELPIFDVGQASRVVAQAEMRRLQHAYAALAIEIGAATRKTMRRVEVSAQRVARYQNSILPLQEQITHQTQLQYNAMQLGVFQLLRVKEVEIATRNAYIDELLNYWIARTELEQIRNGLLVQTSGTASPSAEMPMAGDEGEGH